MNLMVKGRTPHGVRGLKFGFHYNVYNLQARRTPHGVRGLKLCKAQTKKVIGRRTPHGVRGLKCISLLNLQNLFVAPLMGCVD